MPAVSDLACNTQCHFPNCHGPCIPPLSSAMDSLFSSCVGKKRKGGGWVVKEVRSRMAERTTKTEGSDNRPLRTPETRLYARYGTGVNHRVVSQKGEGG